MKKVALCLLVGLLIVSSVVPVTARRWRGRCWDWETGLLSRRAWVFSRSLPSSLIQGGPIGAPSLGIGRGLANLGKAISDGIDRGIASLEKKVSDYGLGGAIGVLISAPLTTLRGSGSSNSVPFVGPGDVFSAD